MCVCVHVCVSTNKITADLVEQLRKRQDPSLVTREEWLSGHMMLIKCLFYPPADVKKTWRGVIMTDGISCSWSRSTETSTVKRKKGTESIIVPLSRLGHVDPQARPKELGRHGESVWIDRGPLNIVAVDPGHATLVDAIRYHHNGIPASMGPSTETPSKNQNTTSKSI